MIFIEKQILFVKIFGQHEDDFMKKKLELHSAFVRLATYTLVDNLLHRAFLKRIFSILFDFLPALCCNQQRKHGAQTFLWMKAILWNNRNRLLRIQKKRLFCTNKWDIAVDPFSKQSSRTFLPYKWNFLSSWVICNTVSYSALTSWCVSDASYGWSVSN